MPHEGNLGAGASPEALATRDGRRDALCLSVCKHILVSAIGRQHSHLHANTAGVGLFPNLVAETDAGFQRVEKRPLS